MLLLISASLAQDAEYSRDSCTEDANLEQLRSAYKQGEEAFSNLDLDGLTGASDDAEGALPCLNEPIDPYDASAYHRLMGLNAFAEYTLNCADEAAEPEIYQRVHTDTTQARAQMELALEMMVDPEAG